jgi:hypothetical protein
MVKTNPRTGKEIKISYIGTPEKSIQSISNKISNYEDPGTEFKGYSRSLLSNNQYKLNPQEEADINISTTYAGGELSTNINNNTLLSKTFYCTDIIMSAITSHLVGSTDIITINDRSTLRLVLSEVATQNNVLQFHFTVPIKFTKGGYFNVSYNTARSANDHLSFNAYGWFE